MASRNVDQARVARILLAGYNHAADKTETRQEAMAQVMREAVEENTVLDLADTAIGFLGAVLVHGFGNDGARQWCYDIIAATQQRGLDEEGNDAT